MKKITLILISFILLDMNLMAQLFNVDTIEISGKNAIVYFYDHLVDLAKEKDLTSLVGAKFRAEFDKIRFSKSTYILEVRNDDNYQYFIFQANDSKKKTPYFFDMHLVESKSQIEIKELIVYKKYKNKIIKTIDAKGVRGGAIYEHSLVAQKDPSIIGNGIQITKGIFDRVIPFREISAKMTELIASEL